MAIVLLILIGLALLAGVIFLAYKFGDFIIEMFAQSIGMPKGEIAMLLFGIVFAAISIVILIKIYFGVAVIVFILNKYLRSCALRKIFQCVEIETETFSQI